MKPLIDDELPWQNPAQCGAVDGSGISKRNAKSAESDGSRLSGW